MFKYMLFFAAGYWFGSGGKLPPKPDVQVGQDGSLLIRPPQNNPSTQQYAPPAAQPATWEVPATFNMPPGTRIDASGNLYSADGRLVGNVAQQGMVQ